MSDVNKLIIMGRLVKDAETKTTNTGLVIANFSIANNRSRKASDGTWESVPHFFNFSLYNKRAESLLQYLVKGQQVLIEGHLVQRKWEKDGTKQSRIEIEIEDIKLIGSGRNRDTNPELNSPNIPFEHTGVTKEEEFAEPQFDTGSFDIY